MDEGRKKGMKREGGSARGRERERVESRKGGRKEGEMLI